MKKVYVLDTNVLLSDPNSIDAFEDNHVVIPMLVLEELDKHKTRLDEVGHNARQVARKLDVLRDSGNLREGINTTNGGTLRIMASKKNPRDLLPAELLTGSSLDNMIIAFMLEGQLESPTLVSKDINLRVKCDSVGIPCQDYLHLRVSENIDSIYTGVKVVLTDEQLVDDFYAAQELHPVVIKAEPVLPNQIVVIKSVDAAGNTLKSAMSRVHSDGLLKPIQKFDSVFGLKPRNKEQQFSIDLLMDPSVNLVTMTGRAGCGKTLLALAAGLEQLESLGSTPRYTKLVVSRPVQTVGKDIGFLPGTLEEKMEPWIAPIRDNLEHLFGSTTAKKKITGNRKKSEEGGPTGFRDPYLDIMQQKGLIEIEAISFIRGRSIPNAFIIIDEAQNLTVHELKTIITRAGEGTKIVLTGDIEQIDNVHVDALSNGLTYAIEKFKEYDLAGHVTLLKGERSTLATLASKIL